MRETPPIYNTASLLRRVTVFLGRLRARPDNATLLWPTPGFYFLFRSCSVCEDRQASMSIFNWAYSRMLHHLSSGSERHSTVIDRTAQSACTVWAAAGLWRSCISAARYTKP